MPASLSISCEKYGLVPTYLTNYEMVSCPAYREFATMRPEHAYYSEYVGEYLAISEFNAEHDMQKISEIPHLTWIRERPAAWNEQMYVMHDFAHPDYMRNITPSGDRHRHMRL